MSGYPNRPLRSDFGPHRRNDGVIDDPELYVGADTFNLEHWQIAGLGLVSPRAIALLRYDGTALQVLMAAEAWDPKALHAPTAARLAPGHYELTYDTHYPDQDGKDVAVSLFGGLAEAQVLNNHRAVAVVRPNGHEVDVQVRNAVTHALADAPVLALLW